MQFNSNDKVEFAKEHILPRYISSYLSHLEKNNIDPKFSRNLPNNWIYSEIDFFVTAYIIKNYERWEWYTPNQILTFWIESVGMENI